MAYDLELADRIREVVQAQRGLAEKRMFGGPGVSYARSLPSKQSSAGCHPPSEPTRTDLETSESPQRPRGPTIAVVLI